MNEGGKYGNFAFITNDKSAKVADPGDGAFDFPSPDIATQLASVLDFWFSLVAAVRANEVDASLGQSLAKRVAVTSLVVDQAIRILPWSAAALARNGDFLQSRLDQRRLVGRCGFDLNSQRYTLAICHHHKLCTLSAFGFFDAFAPFFAGENVPSAKHSSHWSLPFSSSIPRSFRHACINEPSSSHWTSRRQQVLGDGNRFGKSFHLAPLRSTHKIPSKQGRFGTGLGPPLLDAVGCESNDSIFSHCDSFTSNPTSYVRRGINSPPCENSPSLNRAAAKSYFNLMTNKL